MSLQILRTIAGKTCSPIPRQIGGVPLIDYVWSLGASCYNQGIPNAALGDKRSLRSKAFWIISLQVKDCKDLPLLTSLIYSLLDCKSDERHLSGNHEALICDFHS
jgi:hypothetical protein